jgi:hypothetical protein
MAALYKERGGVRKKEKQIIVLYERLILVSFEHVRKGRTLT